MLVLVRSFSYAPDTNFIEYFLLSYTADFSKLFLLHTW